MIEIVGIMLLVSNLSKTTRQRGVSGWWAALGPGLWITGEVMGLFVGGMLDLELFETYGVSLTYAVLGAVVAIVVVTNVPSPVA